MKKLKRCMALMVICCMVFTGCNNLGEEITETIAELSEDVLTEDVIEEPEKNITQIDLPDAYDYREENQLPRIQNQEQTNHCWAFASLAALESSKAAQSEDLYSAEHLIFHNPFGKQFEDGGSYVVTTAYVLAWIGPVLDVEGDFAGILEEVQEPAVHVQEIRQIEPKDYDALKRFVYLYGGVETALYLDFNEYMASSACYNQETASYCYKGEESSNHDVVVVGWDDAYPAENFLGNVTEDGAFLCQNSWGESFGEQGLFYVSYEDVNIGSYGVVYSRIESIDNYDQIYQTDLCGYIAQIGYEDESCWFANVYTAEDALSLRAAGFYATREHTEYEIYVVPKFEDKNSFKNKKYLCNGFLEDGGYYTIDFPQAVDIEAGEQFAVLVKIETENAEYPVAIECQVDGFSENADLFDGEGYLSYQGSLWEHIEETREYNICLKAYADFR